MQNMPARARKAVAARPAAAGDSGHVGPAAAPAPRDVKAGLQIVRPSGRSPKSPVHGACNIRLQRLDKVCHERQLDCNPVNKVNCADMWTRSIIPIVRKTSSCQPSDLESTAAFYCKGIHTPKCYTPVHVEL